MKAATAGLVSLGLIFVTLASAQPQWKPAAVPSANELQLTTKSPKARRLVLQGWSLHVDGFHEAEGAADLRKAIALDPNFAMAHQLLAAMKSQGAEGIAEQKKAFEARANSSPNEQLLIEWQTAASEGHMIRAIEKLNDVLAHLPHDKIVVHLASDWLADQGQSERSIAVYERSGITDSPGLLDLAAYLYAGLRQFDKAIVVLDKYVALLPNEPNPLDTYGDVLRTSGQYEKALDKYHAALAIDPSFFGSQFGIANTYALMGDEPRARKEYAIGFTKFKVPEGKLFAWRMSEAATYVREGDLDRANQAFQTVADSAHAAHLSGIEADTYRQMALYQRDTDKALEFLDKATAALEANQNISKSAAAVVSAQILRAEIERFTQAGHMDRARTDLARLSRMADESHNPVIDRINADAAGNVLFHEAKYTEVIDQLLSESLGDNRDPLSLRLLVEAYRRTGNQTAAKAVSETLANTNDLTIEQAVVVPAFRKCYREPNCKDDSQIFSAQQH